MKNLSIVVIIMLVLSLTTIIANSFVDKNTAFSQRNVNQSYNACIQSSNPPGCNVCSPGYELERAEKGKVECRPS